MYDSKALKEVKTKLHRDMNITNYILIFQLIEDIYVIQYKEDD